VPPRSCEPLKGDCILGRGAWTENTLSLRFEYFAEDALLPLDSPWDKALLPLEPVLLPLLLQELLLGEITLGSSTFTPLSESGPEFLEPTWESFLLLVVDTEDFLSLSSCLLLHPYSCRSHSAKEDPGADDRGRGMETPNPGTPLTPLHRLDVSSTISSEFLSD